MDMRMCLQKRRRNPPKNCLSERRTPMQNNKWKLRLQMRKMEKRAVRKRKQK
ncbi:hypothetical protein DNTS_006715 [Danionella cerebrum]|uniref:Uncharacterized protein n=1 Tax=Danionella cerebrum TaxID=2873325 RepID=A0A553RM91_9TELE|nr:hypothetical protein DNTS_006715 [Danionella translucida]TRZ03285.1 hypothetical protein DNTS_006715 [Danionella translucida]TRZ03286.1 hypothetical protein DNTS_006715 [Danionella translucida]